MSSYCYISFDRIPIIATKSISKIAVNDNIKKVKLKKKKTDKIMKLPLTYCRFQILHTTYFNAGGCCNSSFSGKF